MLQNLGDHLACVTPLLACAAVTYRSTAKPTTVALSLHCMDLSAERTGGFASPKRAQSTECFSIDMLVVLSGRARQSGAIQKTLNLNLKTFEFGVEKSAWPGLRQEP